MAAWSYQQAIFERVTRYIFHKETTSQARKCWRSKPPFPPHHESSTLQTRLKSHVSTSMTRVAPFLPYFLPLPTSSVMKWILPSFGDIGHLHLLRGTQKELRISFRLWCLSWYDDSKAINGDPSAQGSVKYLIWLFMENFAGEKDCYNSYNRFTK